MVNPVDKTKIASSNVVRICITEDDLINVTDNNGVTNSINNGKFIETCILGTSSTCVANSDGEYKEGTECCKRCN